ncbi:hypothetical protein FOZ63_024601 [Perkinsus olseni]|uniref:Methyltransferase type 11 domain-containing protein n=2 Tax=Perkinsus olseni TaxID=32597 RepID=A0A7J6RXN2_PEROL|nr:hypothetical protein FOZ63_024601 [Perkinsus olseni]
MQVFAQPYQSSVHGPDQMKWQMAKDLCPAMLDRPDSAAQGVWAYPLPMTSVDQMVSRVSEQQKLVAQAEGMMENVKVQYSNLEGYVSVTTLKELEKARLRHQQLISKLTNVTALIDKLAQSRQPQQLVGGAYAQAEAAYSELERRAAVVQGRFAEARYKASMAEQRSGAPGAPGSTAELSSADQQKLLKIVKDQTICIQQLQSEMRKTVSDVENVHSKAVKSHQQQYRSHGDPLRALGHIEGGDGVDEIMCLEVLSFTMPHTGRKRQRDSTKPEVVAGPGGNAYSSAEEAEKYGSVSNQKIQAELTATAVQLMKTKGSVDGAGLWLELGCGSGFSTRAITRRNRFIVATDISMAMMDLIEDRGGLVDKVLMDMGRPWPLRPGVADTVLSISAAQWLIDEHGGNPDVTRQSFRELDDRIRTVGCPDVKFCLQLYPVPGAPRQLCAAAGDNSLVMAYPHGNNQRKFFITNGPSSRQWCVLAWPFASCECCLHAGRDKADDGQSFKRHLGYVHSTLRTYRRQGINGLYGPSALVGERLWARYVELVGPKASAGGISKEWLAEQLAEEFLPIMHTCPDESLYAESPAPIEGGLPSKRFKYLYGVVLLPVS